jgi:O-antigen/teichoic acid export membrane protein
LILGRRWMRGDFVKHGTLVFSSTMLGSVFLYAFHFILSRRLGVEQYGTLASLLAGILLVMVLSTVGTTIIARFAAEFAAVDDQGKLRRLCDVLVLWCTGIVVIAIMIGYALRGAIGDFLHIGDVGLIELTALAAALSIALPMLRGVLQGAQRFTAFAVSTLVEQVGRTLLAVLLVMAGFGVIGAIGGIVIALFVTLGYTYASLRRNFSASPNRMRIDFRRLIITTSGIAASIFGITTLTFFDVVLAKHYLTAVDAGLYGAATLAGRVIYTVISFLPIILLPKAASRAARGESAIRLLLQAIGAALSFSAIALAIYGLFPATIIRMFAGPAYVGAAPLVFPLGAATAMLACANVVISYKIGLHRFDFIAPLLLVLLGEVIAISRFHASAQDIVRTLLVGHALVLVSTLYRITAPTRLRSPLPTASPEIT